MWLLRAEAKRAPIGDHVLRGVVGEPLTKNQQEILESEWGTYVRSDQVMPGRFLSSGLIQSSLDEVAERFKDSCWGILTAHVGEFIAPDTFGPQYIVPLTPTLCLHGGGKSGALSKSGVAMMNRYAVQSSQEYYMARDFAACPGLS